MKYIKKLAPVIFGLVILAFAWNIITQDTGPEYGAMSHYSKNEARNLASIIATVTDGSISMVAGTGSMKTFISDPSFVVVIKKYKAVKSGYVCIYKYEGIRIIHRVHDKQENGWRMKGDATSIFDEGRMT